MKIRSRLAHVMYDIGDRVSRTMEPMENEFVVGVLYWFYDFFMSASVVLQGEDSDGPWEDSK